MFHENMVDFPVTNVSEPCKNFRSFRDGFVELPFFISVLQGGVWSPCNGYHGRPGAARAWLTGHDDRLITHSIPWDERYIYLHVPYKFRPNVGKYTIQLDGMGYTQQKSWGDFWEGKPYAEMGTLKYALSKNRRVPPLRSTHFSGEDHREWEVGLNLMMICMVSFCWPLQNNMFFVNILDRTMTSNLHHPHPKKW